MRSRCSFLTAARPAVPCTLCIRWRGKGIRAGPPELQTLWPFPAELVRDRTEGARNVYVVEMNMGHVTGAGQAGGLEAG